MRKSGVASAMSIKTKKKYRKALKRGLEKNFMQMRGKEFLSLLDNLCGRWCRSGIFSEQETALLMQYMIEPKTIRRTIYNGSTERTFLLGLIVLPTFFVTKF